MMGHDDSVEQVPPDGIQRDLARNRHLRRSVARHYLDNERANVRQCLGRQVEFRGRGSGEEITQGGGRRRDRRERTTEPGRQTVQGGQQIAPLGLVEGPVGLDPAAKLGKSRWLVGTEGFAAVSEKVRVANVHREVAFWSDMDSGRHERTLGSIRDITQNQFYKI